jgi:hypothetical protein
LVSCRAGTLKEFDGAVLIASDTVSILESLRECATRDRNVPGTAAFVQLYGARRILRDA